MAMDWFRWHHGSVTDPKFQLVAKKAGASVAEVLAVWACLLEEASQAEERGLLGAIDFEALDCTLGMVEGRCKAIYERMNERGLFTEDGAIEAWDRRQPKREREDPTNAERQRTFRAKQNQVTPDNASDNQKKPRLDEIREEKKERERRATRIPPNFNPEPEPDAERGLDRHTELLNFRDYWTAKSGAQATKLDWQATWRQWARKAYRKPADVARMTVPGKPGRDPELVKLDEDAKRAAPIPLDQLERMAKLRIPKELSA